MKLLIIAALSHFISVISIISCRLAGRVALHFYCTPSIRCKEKTKDLKVMSEAQNTELLVNGKRVKTYQWGDGKKIVLLLHGWESRASRFSMFVSSLLEKGYSVVAFDAPAHGNSEGTITNLFEYDFICQELAKKYPHYTAVIGHSLGTSALFYSLRKGITTDCMVLISGLCDFRYTLDAFARILNLTPKVIEDLESRIIRFYMPDATDFWQKFSLNYNNAEDIKIPTYIIHDRFDDVINLAQAEKIKCIMGHRATLYITNKLGHHRILQNRDVVNHVINFISKY